MPQITIKRLRRMLALSGFFLLKEVIYGKLDLEIWGGNR